jgi:hypothetical protein
MTRNRLRGVLAGFLGTYTSRYSDYRGYWLFGLLVDHAETLTFDLLEPGGSANSADDFAARLARLRFSEQLERSGLPTSIVRQAKLIIERGPSVTGVAGERLRRGFQVTFRATVVSDTGRCFEREAVVFVAPHNPVLEYRSARVPVPTLFSRVGAWLGLTNRCSRRGPAARAADRSRSA